MFHSLALKVTVALFAVAIVAAPVAGADHRFVAPMSGAEENPPVDTNATGVATFKLSSDETELSFRLIAANIENTIMAHIHCGPAGVNGSIALWLYPDAPPPALIPGRFQGVLATGTATSADIVPVADSAACPGGVADLDDLLEKMRTGGAYVNVHTTQFPGGEIRGQIH
jgi:hypothetical protein